VGGVAKPTPFVVVVVDSQFTSTVLKSGRERNRETEKKGRRISNTERKTFITSTQSAHGL